MDRAWPGNAPSQSLGGGRSGGGAKRAGKGGASSQSDSKGRAGGSQHWQAGFANPHERSGNKGGSGNHGRFADHGAKANDQIVQSIGDLKDIVDMGLRWGMDPELDQRVRNIVSDMTAVVASAQQARNAAMEEVSAKFGIDLFEDSGGQAASSSRSSNPVYHYANTWDPVPAGDRTSPVLQGEQLLGGWAAAAAGNGDTKPRAKNQPLGSHQPESQLNMGGFGGPACVYGGQSQSGSMGGDIGSHMQEGPGNKVSVSTHPMATASSMPAARRKDMTRPTVAPAPARKMPSQPGYVVKNTFIEPAEDTEGNQENLMRASAILFRSEQGLSRKQKYDSNNTEDNEDLDELPVISESGDR